MPYRTACAAAAPRRLTLLGPLTLTERAPDAPLDLPGGRAALLFALLAAHRNRVVDYPTIVDTLWPDSPPQTARRTVASLVSRLRQSVGACLERIGPGYRLDTTHWQVDLDEAARLVTAAEQHLAGQRAPEADAAARQALDLLTAGRAVEDYPTQPWAEDLDRAAELLLRRARRAAWPAAAEVGGHRRSADLAAAAIAVDPYDEQAVRAVMAAEYRLGSPGAALRAFHRLQHTLRQDFGIDPDGRTLALHRAILQGGRLPGREPKHAAGPVPSPVA
ncbi:BTAD domain-containing putative transcriptional regulator [Kitasatospora sp. NPDC059571]|uniref:AfsR/SARP family transcriptional regulator n=1 Tax=Kitasatospora sp. NPDC059571 TaxID=3346871 RepID=UPI00369E9215